MTVATGRNLGNFLVVVRRVGRVLLWVWLYHSEFWEASGCLFWPGFGCPATSCLHRWGWVANGLAANKTRQGNVG